MKRKYLKKCICAGLICAIAVGTTGCKQLDMTEVTELTAEQENLLVEYCANSVLNYDKNYIDRRQAVKLNKEEETEEPTTQAIEQSTTAGKEENVSSGETASGVTTLDVAVMAINDILGISGVNIQPAGFEVVDSYPSNGQELGMSMVAIKGCKLLVVKFHVTGNGTELNLLEKKATYKGIINNSVKVNAQVTALLEAFNTYKGVIGQGETKELVLVFQVNENDTKNIQSLKLNVTYNDKQGNVIIDGNR